MTATVTDITLQARLRHRAGYEIAQIQTMDRALLMEAADRIDELEAQLGRWIDLALQQKTALMQAEQFAIQQKTVLSQAAKAIEAQL